MTLSEYESKRLRAIEEATLREDPRFARRMTRGARSRLPEADGFGSLALAAVVAVLVTGASLLTGHGVLAVVALACFLSLIGVLVMRAGARLAVADDGRGGLPQSWH
ncbi:DUF3040 domain-containing protein [Catellatospora tritici]|uniref:DUF3040 domain-containing protein n=1 Tax=Catellatospora tritici TaxID=2851566 RepID=UPI001C2D83AB|nr:DUF3040 domain-containing protein [Catellatospora tritici]MBV1856539.1 DUF3040 domain-containing protein [Catellatospora tritici]